MAIPKSLLSQSVAVALVASLALAAALAGCVYVPYDGYGYPAQGYAEPGPSYYYGAPVYAPPVVVLPRGGFGGGFHHHHHHWH